MRGAVQPKSPYNGVAGAGSAAQQLRVYAVHTYGGNDTSGAAARTFTMPVNGVVDIYAWGKGGNGGNSVGTNATSGGGGAAGKRRLSMTAGEQLALSIGGSQGTGTDTTVTLPDASVLTAGRGVTGGSGTGAGGAGGTCSGAWDVTRNGGKGGGENPGGVYDQPVAGSFGGAAGSGLMSSPGGGGAGGFSDELLVQGLIGDGASVTYGEFPGGGGKGKASQSTSTANNFGGAGCVVIVVWAMQS